MRTALLLTIGILIILAGLSGRLGSMLAAVTYPAAMVGGGSGNAGLGSAINAATGIFGI